MARVFWLVLDSVGIGGAPDAARFGDEGANTVGHIADECHAGRGDRDGLRSGPLYLPCLASLGLGLAAELASGRVPHGLATSILRGRFAAASEVSRGKDTPSGHWEMAGVPVEFDWGYFPDRVPSFPAELIDALVREAALPGILGDCHASGTEILVRLGEEHMRTGKPICYTSADSVFQIAAHEETFGLERLLEVCRIARELLGEYTIGRVIARPFMGEPGAFKRTPNRRDFSIPPPSPTVLDNLAAAGRQVVSVGKIADIFAHQGVTKKVKAPDSAGLMALVEEEIAHGLDGSLTFANFVEFDSEFGHRRDVAGYAAALEALDRRLESVLPQLRDNDLLLITADHGCDPTWTGTDHTRERVPVLLYGSDVVPGSAGVLDTYADMGRTVADLLGVEPTDHGSPIPLS